MAPPPTPERVLDDTPAPADPTPLHVYLAYTGGLGALGLGVAAYATDAVLVSGLAFLVFVHNVVLLLHDREDAL